MGNRGEDIRRLLVRDLESLRAEVEACHDEGTLWRAAPGITNSVGNLALHCAGNVRHFVGGILGGSGYARDRDAEFGVRDLPLPVVVAEVGRAIADVNAVLPGLDEAALDRPFPVQVAGTTIPTGRFLMHLAIHLGFHLGQAGYLRRILTGGATIPGIMSPAVLGSNRD